MRIRNGFEVFFSLRFNLSNDNIIFAKRPGLVCKRVWNYIFWSEIGSGFEEPGGTPPPRISRRIPPPPPGQYPDGVLGVGPLN